MTLQRKYKGKYQEYTGVHPAEMYKIQELREGMRADAGLIGLIREQETDRTPMGHPQSNAIPINDLTLTILRCDDSGLHFWSELEFNLFEGNTEYLRLFGKKEDCLGLLSVMELNEMLPGMFLESYKEIRKSDPTLGSFFLYKKIPTPSLRVVK